MKFLIRFFLRIWSKYPKAPGYFSRVVERWGGRLAEKTLEGRLFNGMLMSCNIKDHIQRQIYFRGAYEPIETYLFWLLLRPGMVVIDGGANVGQYTLVAAGAVGERGEVHAFEPVLTNFEQLSKHVSNNRLQKMVHIKMAALWNRQGVVTLSLARNQVDNGGSFTIGKVESPLTTAEAPTVRLDDYVAELGLDRLDFIKLDVEGAEWFALQGAADSLRRWCPTMLLEINRDACSKLGYGPERIWDFLKPYGYRMWAVGQSASTSIALSSLGNVGRANILFHTEDIPPNLLANWSLKSVLRFHRRARQTLLTGSQAVSGFSQPWESNYATGGLHRL